LAGLTAVLTAAWAARRFAPNWDPRAWQVTAALVLASLILAPWYDLKAMGAIVVGAIALATCASSGLRRGLSGAGVALAGAALVPILIGWQLTVFLDQTYYLLVAGL